MNECRSECGEIVFSIPARRDKRFTIRVAAWRSRRRLPSRFRKIGPSSRSPTHRSMARAVRGARGMVATLPPLRVGVNDPMRRTPADRRPGMCDIDMGGL